MTRLAGLVAFTGMTRRECPPDRFRALRLLGCTTAVAGSVVLWGGSLAGTAAVANQDERCASHCCERAEEWNDDALGLMLRPRRSCDHGGRQPNVTGLLVTAVHPSKAADRSGLQQGDVILGVDGSAVRSLEELQAALQAALNRPALILAARDDAFIVLAFPAL